MRAYKVLVVGVLLSLSRGARADEPPPAPPPPVEAPPSAPAKDPPQLVDAFEHAFDDLFARRYADAATAFDRVATSTVEPERRATALELGRRAHLMAERALRAARPADRARDGRYGLLIGSSLLGLGLYGPTAAILENNSDARLRVGSYMVVAGASFFLPFLATADEPVTWGMTDAFWYGSTRGAYHGAMVLELFHPADPNSQRLFAAMSVGSILEGTGATYWAAQTHASAGLTNAMSKGGDFGALFGTAIASTAMTSGHQDTTTLAAGGLVGAVGGIYGGYVLAQHRDLTWGDGEVMRSAALVGIGVAATPLLLGDASNHRVILPVLMAGAGAGLVVGDRLLDGHDFTAGQGIITELSTLAGAGAGAGLGYLISPQDNTSTQGKILIVGAVLGGATGFALAFFGFDTTVAPRASQGPSSIQIVPQIGPDQKGLSVAGVF